MIFNGCGKFSLNQSASIVRKSYAIFTHDTGLMHIAAAFDINFGNLSIVFTPEEKSVEDFTEAINQPTISKESLTIRQAA